jgi:hypothetical protein
MEIRGGVPMSEIYKTEYKPLGVTFVTIEEGDLDGLTARVAELEKAAGLAERALTVACEIVGVCPGCAATIMDMQDHAYGCTWLVALDALRTALEQKP